MLDRPSPTFAVSTWSVHHLLGITYAHGPDTPVSTEARPTYGPGALTLMDLPQALAARGYFRAEICHFHLASTAPDYLSVIRYAFTAAKVAIQTLLIDAGDLTAPDWRHQRDWIAGWIEAASVLGAENARVIAGKAKPTPETLAAAIDGLAEMAQLGEKYGVKIVTENWFDLLPGPEEVEKVLKGVGPSLGLLADTGNWRGSDKYDKLRAIFPHASLCHAKSDFSDRGVHDEDDCRRWLDAAIDANYRGPYTLIYASGGDEWQGLATERAFAERHFATRTLKSA
jgi:sugar phosphate isomerase/epimerase